MGQRVRVIVHNELSQVEHNAMLHLFSSKEELIRFGAAHFEPYSEETSTLLSRLFDKYREEGYPMAETLQKFGRRVRREMMQDPEQKALLLEEFRASMTPQDLLQVLTPEQILSLLPPEQILSLLPPEQILSRLTPEQILSGLTPEQILPRFTPDQILASLSPEQREVLLQRLATDHSTEPE